MAWVSLVYIEYRKHFKKKQLKKKKLNFFWYKNRIRILSDEK